VKQHLEGIHHVSSITGDAAGNVDFYVRVMGMRLVKKTVNQDDPGVYHLFYGDETGTPGFDMTFFEYPGARPGRAGQGMVHTVAFRVASTAALDFWTERLAAERIEVRREDDRLRFEDPEGLTLELVVEDVPDAPLAPNAPGIPAEHALLGFAGVRAYTDDAGRSQPLLERVLGFRRVAGTDRWEARGDDRGGWIEYDAPPAERGIPGAGTVHHVAWATEREDQDAWQRHVTAAGAHATPIVDRFYFQAVYFREPSGVLFELATRGPGFTVDEPAETLGDHLALPPFLEDRRAEIERVLTPLPAYSRSGTPIA
jgi:glyoxalase family protein